MKTDGAAAPPVLGDPKKATSATAAGAPGANLRRLSRRLFYVILAVATLVPCTGVILAWLTLPVTPGRVFSAIENGDEKCVRKYLEKNSTETNRLHYTAHNKDGSTFLHVACEEGRPEIVRLLLEFNADINIKDDYGRTPLMRLVMTESSENRLTCLSMLLEAKPDLACVDKGPENALGLAVYEPEYVKILLAAGARPMPTLLHYVSQMRETASTLEVLGMLLDAGMDPCTKDQSGKTPLDYGTERKNHKIASLLVDRIGNRK